MAKIAFSKMLFVEFRFNFSFIDTWHVLFHRKKKHSIRNRTRPIEVTKPHFGYTAKYKTLHKLLN